MEAGLIVANGDSIDHGKWTQDRLRFDLDSISRAMRLT
jgi:hypothetical protein